MAKTLTIKDIAELANVSASAVSFALNNKKGISAETRQRILKIVEENEYIPNQQARRLLTKRTNNIGILHEREHSPLSHWFLHEILSPAAKQCEELGFNLLFSPANGDRDNLIPEIVRNREVDGIIILGETDPLVIEKLRETEFPLVLVDEHLRTPDVFAVEADYAQGALTAVDYLVTRGHRKIGYIGDSADSFYGSQTYRGYLNALEEARIKPEKGLIFHDARDGDEETALRCMERLLSKTPTAVFCAADIYAIGAVKAIRKAGMTVPGDISVIGMDNLVLGKYVDPELTTIDFRKEEMGREAVNILIKLTQDERHPEKKRVFPGELLVRSSVRDV
jgi:LacI family transcriptional regulator